MSGLLFAGAMRPQTPHLLSEKVSKALSRRIITQFKQDSAILLFAANTSVCGCFSQYIAAAGGLACLIFGGNLFVRSAEAIARILGVSDKFIAITILAMGTSLPEFVTSIVALAKKRGQLALGNILGSNVFNLLLILGVSAIITPTSFARIDVWDYVALLLSIILVWTGIYTGKKDELDRVDACLLLLLFVAYMTKLFINL